MSNRIPPATISDFTDFIALPRVTSKKNWALLSASKSNAGHERNLIATARLCSYLSARKHTFEQATGSWGGVEEMSFLALITHGEAVELGRIFEQESVITHRGLVTLSTGEIMPIKSVNVIRDAKTDFTRVHGGVEFSFVF